MYSKKNLVYLSIQLDEIKLQEAIPDYSVP